MVEIFILQEIGKHYKAGLPSPPESWLLNIQHHTTDRDQALKSNKSKSGYGRNLNSDTSLATLGSLSLWFLTFKMEIIVHHLKTVKKIK